MDKGVLDKKLERSMYTTFLASTFRTLRFGLGADACERHRHAGEQPVRSRRDSRIAPMGSFSIDVAKAKKRVTDLTRHIMTIQATGDLRGCRCVAEEDGGRTAGSAACAG